MNGIEFTLPGVNLFNLYQYMVIFFVSSATSRMQFSVDQSGCSATYNFTGEGHTLGNPLARRLLLHQNVEFAAYEVPHPLEDAMKVTLMSDGSQTPGKCVEEALDSLVKDIRSLESSLAEYLAER